MNEKWDIFDKYYYKTDKYYSYDKLPKELKSFWNTYKTESEETSQERKARLLRERAQERETKIDLILKK